nr:uncharacterized protein [uncultured bacterium]
MERFFLLRNVLYMLVGTIAIVLVLQLLNVVPTHLLPGQPVEVPLSMAVEAWVLTAAVVMLAYPFVMNRVGGAGSLSATFIPQEILNQVKPAIPVREETIAAFDKLGNGKQLPDNGGNGEKTLACDGGAPVVRERAAPQRTTGAERTEPLPQAQPQRWAWGYGGLARAQASKEREVADVRAKAEAAHTGVDEAKVEPRIQAPSPRRFFKPREIPIENLATGILNALGDGLVLIVDAAVALVSGVLLEIGRLFLSLGKVALSKAKRP